MGNITEAPVLYTCARDRMGQGIAVPAGEEPTPHQVWLAASMVHDCEGRNRTDGRVHHEYGECPAECGLRILAQMYLAQE